MIKANKRNFLFEEVKMTAPERNGFDLSHENKQTCRAGKVYPFEILEALPGDDFEIQTEQFIRLSPMLSPTMHRVKSYWHWFFMPNRLCWKYWEEFISRGNGKKLPPNQEYTPPEPPQISFLDLLYCSDYIFNAHSSYNVETQHATYEEAVAKFTTKNPQFAYIHNVKLFVDNINASYSFETDNATLVCYRTPRVANALGIPDTSIPFAFLSWDSLGHKSALYPLKSSTHYFDNLILYDLQQYIDNAYQRLSEIKLSLLPFIAYLRIYAEYYRDENLDEDLTNELDYFYNLTGNVDYNSLSEVEKHYFKRLFQLNYRCWEKDYFTTATQLPQKSPDVEIPGTGTVQGTLPVKGEVLTTVINGLSIEHEQTNNAATYDRQVLTAQQNKIKMQGLNLDGHDAYSEITSHLRGNISADSILYNASVDTTQAEQLQPTTVAQVRRAFALQRWFEKAVRTGTRYIESLKAFFNSDAGDARLQRPEFIGGSSAPIQISDVVQTSATDDTSDTVQGNLAGYGISSDNSEIITYHAPEHGFILGCFSILARTSYSQGIPRLFSRETWLDYAWPEFEHIGEQGIKQKEIAAVPLSNRIMTNSKNLLTGFYSDASHDPNSIFGYQSRYSEYKQMPDRFGSGFTSSLDFWTLGRIFDASPSLSTAFVHAQISDRNFAVVGKDDESTYTIYNYSDKLDESYDYDTYQCDFWLDIKKVTSLSLYSEPM